MVTYVNTNIEKLRDNTFKNLRFRGEPNNRGDKLYLLQCYLLKKGAIAGDDLKLKSATIDYALDECLVREFGTLDLSKIEEKING